MEPSTDKPQTIAKDRTLAGLLGFVLGSMAWLYTYERDKIKFWVGFGLEWLGSLIAFVALVFIISGIEQPAGSEEVSWEEIREAIVTASSATKYALIAGIATLPAVRLWAIADAFLRRRSQYSRYKIQPLSKIVAVVFAVLFGYIAWLYTYERDGNKFYVGLAIQVATLLSALATLYVTAYWMILGFITLVLSLSLALSGIWIWALVDTALKKVEWYKNYPWG